MDTEKLASEQGRKSPTAKSASIIGNSSLNFDGHRILSLDDVQHQNTHLDKLLSWYGESDGGGTCAVDFGNDLIKKWRGTGEPYCSAKGSKISSIDCFLIHQTSHHGGGDNLCLMKNVAVNIGEKLLGSPSSSCTHHNSTNELMSTKTEVLDCSRYCQFNCSIYSTIAFLRSILGLFGDDVKTRPVIEKYVETRHNVQPYIKYVRLFITSSVE